MQESGSRAFRSGFKALEGPGPEAKIGNLQDLIGKSLTNGAEGGPFVRPLRQADRRGLPEIRRSAP